MRHNRGSPLPLYIIGSLLFLVAVYLSTLAVLDNYSRQYPPNRKSTEAVDQNQERVHSRLSLVDQQVLLDWLDIRTLPNLRLISDLPAITGEPAADSTIRELAISMNINKTAEPVLELVEFTHQETNSRSVLLQPYVIDDMSNLLNEAQRDNLPLRIVEGYHSVEEATDIFQIGLESSAVTPSQLVRKQNIEALITVLERQSPPGFSYTHTGFAISFSCDELSEELFISSICYSRLKRNNFELARKHGIIPVLPDYDDRQQLINLRPWQYLWVGRDTTYID